MKKVIFMLMVALFTVVGMTSCKSTQFGLVYNVEVVGDGDGDFTVTFPEGHYSMNGTAALELQVGDTVPFNQVTAKATVLESNNTKQLEVMRKVNASVGQDFTATAASGTYDVTVRGTVTEIATGLTFSINKHLTNREALQAPVRELDGVQADEFEFIR